MSKQILSIPSKGLKSLGKGIKAGAEAAMKPATTSSTWQFILGAALGAPASSIYSSVYNMTLGQMKIPAAINLGVKVLAPLVPIYFVKKSKIPFGNIINGTLLGITIAQCLNIGFGLLAGNLISNSDVLPTVEQVLSGALPWE